MDSAHIKSDERIRYEMLPSHHREIETQHNKGEFVRVDTATHQANKKEKAEGEQPRTFPKTWRRATGTLPVGMPELAVPRTARCVELKAGLLQADTHTPLDAVFRQSV